MVLLPGSHTVSPLEDRNDTVRVSPTVKGVGKEETEYVMLVIWCRRTKCGEESALGPWPNLLGITMEMPPASSVGVSA